MGRKKRRQDTSDWEQADKWVASKTNAAASCVMLSGMPILPPATSADYEVEVRTEAEVQSLFADSESITMLVGRNVLSSMECEEWIRWGEATGFILERHAQTAHVAHRDNWRLAIQSEAIACAIFDRLRPWVPDRVGTRRACGCNPNIRLYKYLPGQRFGPHVDQSCQLSDGSMTEFTVLLYLGDGKVAGGETIFYDPQVSSSSSNVLFAFSPLAGAVLVHAHGERCLTHEGASVTGGVKYLLRTDIAYR